MQDVARKRGMKIAEIERAAGLSKGSISKWKTVSPTVGNLQAVANVLKVKVDVLLKDG